jgi:hypothetical protein
MKTPTEPQMKKAAITAEERIARAKLRIQQGNSTREDEIADCEREKKKRELARDVVGAMAWSLTALGLGQNQSPRKRKGG